MSGASLHGRAALVTGAAKRIGREIAFTLAGDGASIVIHYRSARKEADELAREIAGLGVGSWTVQADFENLGETETLVDRALSMAGSLDILVNSASVFPAETIDDLTFEGLIANVRINAWAPFVLIRSFAEKVGRGKIVNLLDSRLEGYDFRHVGYILSKHVLAAMTKMAALRYAPEITVNEVSPGLILPPPGKDEAYLDSLTDTVPLRKHGDPQDVADAVLFLAKSDFVTGEVIYVDGGRHLKEYLDPRTRP